MDLLFATMPVPCHVAPLLPIARALVHESPLWTVPKPVVKAKPVQRPRPPVLLAGLVPALDEAFVDFRLTTSSVDEYLEPARALIIAVR